MGLRGASHHEGEHSYLVRPLRLAAEPGPPSSGATALPPVLGAVPKPEPVPSPQARLQLMVREHFDLIWRLLRRLGVPPSNVDDAAQEVFVVAARRVDAIALGSERSYLFGTALRVAKSMRRQAARDWAHSAQLPDDAMGSETPADELLDQKRQVALLDELLARLEETERSVFVLFELEGMTLTEIATLMEVPGGRLLHGCGGRAVASFARWRCAPAAPHPCEGTMSDPKRLVDVLDAGIERNLLISGAKERPAASTRNRVEAHVLDIAAATVTASTIGAGGASGGSALAKSGSALGGMVLKWLGIGALAGGVIAIGGSEISSRVFDESPPARAAEVSESRSLQSTPPGVVTKRGTALGAEAVAVAPEETEPSSGSETRTEPKPARGNVLIGKSATLLEAESLRAVQLAQENDPSVALRLVRQHLKRFPDGATATEARRIERDLTR